MSDAAALRAAERLWGPGCAAPEQGPLFSTLFPAPPSEGPLLLCGAGFGAPALALNQPQIDAYEADAAIAAEGARRLAQAGAAARVRLRDRSALIAARPQGRFAAAIALRWPDPPDVALPVFAAALRPGGVLAIFALVDTAPAGARSSERWRAAAGAQGLTPTGEPSAVTTVYRDAVMAGLARRVAAIGRADGGLSDAATLAAAAEPWLRRVEAMDSGRIAALRMAFSAQKS